jgi:hypothetical protein
MVIVHEEISTQDLNRNPLTEPVVAAGSYPQEDR